MYCPFCGLPFYGIDKLPNICPRCGSRTFTQPEQEELETPSAVPDGLNHKGWCPECKQKAVIRQNGCEHCEICGWEQCG